MSGVTFGSVCSGIEAASVAWESLGWRAVWLAEIEPFPSAVLAHRYPTVPNLGDMTAIAARVLSGEVEAPDVLVGGTPCQAFSVAGLRAGLTDQRGQLTLRFMELANAIDSVRIAAGKPPCVVVWENVPGVLSDKTNAFGCFLGGLAGEDEQLFPAGKKWTHAGAVYGPERAIAWRTFDAQYFRVAQRRRRVFVIASARNGFDPAEILFEREGVRRDIAPRRSPGEGFTHDVVPCLTSGGRGVARTGETRGQDPVVGCWWNGGQVSQTLDAVLAKGQCMPDRNRFPAVLVPLAFEPRYYLRDNKTGGAPSETVLLSATNASKAGDAAPCVAACRAAYGFQTRIGRNGRGDTGDVASALTSQAGQTGKGDAAPCVALAFSCKDHGADATVDLCPTLRSMGHAGSHANGGGQLAVCIGGDVAHTLRAEGFDASEDGTGRGQPIVAFAQNSRDEVREMPYAGALSAQSGMKQTSYVRHAMAVRRITPTECERLQGFTDGWTLVPIRGKPAADGPRYKALGNSMAVPCMRWIGARIDANLKDASKKTKPARRRSSSTTRKNSHV